MCHRLRPAFLFGLLLLTSACRYINPQDDIESKLAHDLIMRMKIYDVMSPNTPVTNLYQLFPNANSEPAWYPHKLHQRLLDFGKYAGFKTSIVEKYVFFWPRLTHPKLYGEVICMSARPFPDINGRLIRAYISNTGKAEIFHPPGNSGTNPVSNAYAKTFIAEDWVQLIFREAKPSIVPLPPSQQPPPLPPELRRTLNHRYEEFVWNLSGALGQDSSMPVRIILKVGAIIVVCALTFFCVFFIRRSRRPEPPPPKP